MTSAEPEPKPTIIPKVPQEFGEDGGNFYKCYDALAQELDEDMVKRLQSQLNSILIFAGLFAGVNSAFLALTLPDMRADPADDTNALLLQLVAGGNSTIRSGDDLPSATFTPSPGIVPVNVLFSLGLTLAILVSFFAILGQQWLIGYCRRSGGGPEHYRWEQLQRYLGARGWGLEVVLDNILPVLLQSALVIFGIAFAIYLQTMNKTACCVVATLMATAVYIIFLMSLACLIDKWCPFKSPLYRFMQLIHHDPVTYWLPMLILGLVEYAIRISVFIAAVGIWLFLFLYQACPRFIVILHGNLSGQIARDLPPPIKPLGSRLQLISKLRGAFVPLGKPAALLQAAAVRRVLCASGDFHTLIYTAVNIQAMNAKEGAQFLLQDDTAFKRLEVLVESSDEALASAFCCAFSHLLLGGQSVELFVSRRERLKYRLIEKYTLTVNTYSKLHPLKTRLGFIVKGLRRCRELSNPGSDTFFELLPYFELLELILGEESNDQQLSKWLDRVVQNQSSAEVSTPLVISLVAAAMRILNEGLDLKSVPYRYWEFELRYNSERYRNRHRLLRVQQRRVVMAKKLIGAIGWNMQLIPSDPPESGRTSALEFIEEAFSACTLQSPRRPANTEIWLLEQALLFSTQGRHQRGWKSVAESSISLLSAFDKPEAPTPDSVSTQDNLKNNRRRCAKIISQCIQAVRDHLVPSEFIQTVSPALNKLVDYWARFKDDFTQNPDLGDSEMLSSWFEIRGALNRPEESGWGPLNQQLFGEAYPSLKIGFDTIASAMFDNAPRVDNRTEHPRDLAFDEQAGRTEPDKAVADPNTPKPDEDSDQTGEGAGESRENEDAREPNSGERNEQPDEQAGHANPKPMDEDE